MSGGGPGGGGGGGECAGLLGCAAPAFALRPRAADGLSPTQPGSAPAAAEAAERFQTCSVSRLRSADATMSERRRGRQKGGGRPPEATTPEAEGKRGAALL